MKKMLKRSINDYYLLSELGSSCHLTLAMESGQSFTYESWTHNLSIEGNYLCAEAKEGCSAYVDCGRNLVTTYVSLKTLMSVVLATDMDMNLDNMRKENEGYLIICSKVQIEY